jgi:uncharacterized cupin superfamily protein
MPDTSHWFIANVAETMGSRSRRFGRAAIFDDPRGDAFPELGFNVRVLEPGHSNGMYHHEGAQECALVLRGECIAIVEDSEHRMGKGDFIHFPRGTPHIIVGAGDGPCTLVMAGSRPSDPAPTYPVSDTAVRHGAGVAEATDDPMVAYAGADREIEPLGEIPW